MSDDKSDIERRIREHAYRLWQEAGSPEGRDQEFWHRARELEKNARQPAGGAGQQGALADTVEDMEQPGSLPSHAGVI